MIFFTRDNLLPFIDANYSIDPDFSLSMEVVDVMNKSIDQTLLVVHVLNEGLESTNSKSRLKTAKFMEILVKNCNMDFHWVLFSKRFCGNLLKVLSKRRKRFELYNPLISNNKLRQEEIENRLLFLIQLWFDTFMFYEADFKNIADVYKQLRLEGVIFPLRDPNSQHYINFDGKKSPIYDTIEGEKIYEEPNKKMSIKQYRVQEVNVQKDIGQEMQQIRFKNSQSNSQKGPQIDFEQMKEVMSFLRESVDAYDIDNESLNAVSLELIESQTEQYLVDLGYIILKTKSDSEKESIQRYINSLREIEQKIKQIKNQQENHKRKDILKKKQNQMNDNHRFNQQQNSVQDLSENSEENEPDFLEQEISPQKEKEINLLDLNLDIDQQQQNDQQAQQKIQQQMSQQEINNKNSNNNVNYYYFVEEKIQKDPFDFVNENLQEKF